MKLGRQTTLKSSVIVEGRGVHSNEPVTLILHPADANTGIVFLRTGLPDGAEKRIEAKWSSVATTELCTVLGEQATGSVSTVEHLLAALAGLGVDNVLIEIDGAEVPIMDGSAAEFVAAVDSVGIRQLWAARRYLKVLRPIRVENGRSFSELRPSASGFRLEVDIDFQASAIGVQTKSLDLTPARFRREISRARTFGSIRDVEKLWKMGFALGSSLENSIAVDEDRILNPEGLRSGDEFVSHKMLDAVGDLALAGAPILGTYRAFCPGHKMNYLVLKALFADRLNYSWVEAPTRPEPLFADFALAPVPAFAAEAN
jgi:UDP-3-O-[3-hydroxymyristoyl] N-acetylglucosamine deacetylase